MVHILRDGSQVADRRLDRIPFWDPRNEDYPARRGIETKPLRSYTHAVYTQLNQGDLGGCVGAGFAHDLAAKPSVVQGITWEFARDKIYDPAQDRDPWPET